MFDLSAYLNMVFDEGSLEERVDRVADAGYDGVELYGMEHVERVADRCDDRDLDLVYVSGDKPAYTDPDRTEESVEALEEAIDRVAAVGCLNLNVKSGQTQPDVDPAVQHESVVEVLERAAPAAERAGITLVLEPLNTRVDHPGHFFSTAADGAEAIAAVDSPNVRLLFDVYHEQIMHGDVIRSFREHFDLIGHVHIADNPGRHEPGTGELNYENVLAEIKESGYDGYVGCEFVPTGDPETALADVKALC